MGFVDHKTEEKFSKLVGI